MYGTVARMRCKPGHRDELVALMEEWKREMKPEATGALSASLYSLDKDEDDLILAVAFRDKASYLKNADDPAQDKFFRRFREHLAADPEWHDGTIIYSD